MTEAVPITDVAMGADSLSDEERVVGGTHCFAHDSPDLATYLFATEPTPIASAGLGTSFASWASKAVQARTMSVAKAKS